ncbi:TlpA family protein disulfide reductase [Bacillus rubiinfantis]|uniref:TlpA family protein disulfide reductase n=1 Tax=Bacillus rubiinfantis TaxID=1499680 RepID=UPI0005A939A5|nr:TlpA disulfide reductase family protein [Bacillus rubiinfantis]
MKLREPMPELTGTTQWINGQVSREELVGWKPTLIHFWSISCHLCKKAMPQINHLREQYQDKINIIAVHMPRSDKDLNIEEIKRIAKEHNIEQPILVDHDRKLTEAFDNKYVPAYYLFDKDGKLRHYQAGGSGVQMLEKRLNRLLQEIENTN